MTDNVINLSKVRAERTGDCQQWSPLDALREAIERIESGELDVAMVYVAFQARHPGAVSYPFCCAGGTNLELTGLLTKHMIVNVGP